MLVSVKRAFTIVELLIVIVVIGILATITIVAYNGIQTDAHLASLQSDVRQAITQLEDMQIETGNYPDSASSLRHSPDTAFTYTKINNRYCLEARNSSKDVGSFYTYGHNIEAGPCPAGYWRLDGDATDSSLYGNNGTVYAANPATDRHGRSGGAYSFNGSGQSIEIDAKLYSFPMTLSVWYKSNNTNTNYIGHLIYATQTGGDGFGAEYETHLSQVDGARYSLFVNSGTCNPIGLSFGNVDTDWHHLAVVLDSKLSAYIDGKLESSYNINCTPDFSSYLPKLYLGRPAASSRYLNGSIDDVRIYHRALTGAEVKQLYEE